VNASPITRRHLWTAACAGYVLGIALERLFSQKPSTRALEERKATHMSFSVRMPGGAEASYAIRTDSTEDAVAFVSATSALLRYQEFPEDSDDPDDPESQESPPSGTPTINFTINHSGPLGRDVDPEQLQSIVRDAVTVHDGPAPTSLRVEPTARMVPPLDDEMPDIPFVTPPTSAEARRYLEEERWQGA
jgi:hypothetical protein